MGDDSRDKNGKLVLENSDPTEDSLNELRRLLLGPIQAKLDKLQKRLDNPDLHARDVSRVLAEAISLRSSRDKKIEIALEPITANAIRSSIKKDRKVLVEALFPVMGPAIRKAIASTIQGMIQSFNQILEYSLSIKGLKWRLEALRTKKTFAEVILLHTLVYQVEQIFLIHGDTGLVLQHAVAKTAVSQDPDLVSGMLTAIKDFVQDSFGATKEETLETLRVGEHSVWIEHGPHALLAAVIRGNPPLDFQSVLRDALDEIHFKQSDELASFNGDSLPFEEVRYILNDCLQAQFTKQKQKKSYRVWIILIAILLLLGWWSFILYSDHRRWSDYLAGLRSQPGILITNIETRSGENHIYGLRDPLAPDPANGLQKAGIRPESVTFHWEPYQSSFPKYVFQRLNDILNPPETTSLELDHGMLRAKGLARHQWIVATRQIVKVIPWIEAYEDSNLIDIDLRIKPPKTVTLKLEGHTLHASGAASHEWIAETRDIVQSMAGILHFNDDQLIDEDQEKLWHLKKKLEKQALFFKAGLDELAPGQEEILKDLVQDFQQMASLAEMIGHQFHIEIIGHTDSTGSEDLNSQISTERARLLLSILMKDGLAAENFSTQGVGSRKPLSEELNAQDQALNRRVTFNIKIFEK